jgi:hypothetical protein
VREAHKLLKAARARYPDNPALAQAAQRLSAGR